MASTPRTAVYVAPGIVERHRWAAPLVVLARGDAVVQWSRDIESAARRGLRAACRGRSRRV